MKTKQNEKWEYFFLITVEHFVCLSHELPMKDSKFHLLYCSSVLSNILDGRTNARTLLLVAIFILLLTFDVWSTFVVNCLNCRQRNSLLTIVLKQTIHHLSFLPLLLHTLCRAAYHSVLYRIECVLRTYAMNYKLTTFEPYLRLGADENFFSTFEIKCPHTQCFLRTRC